MSEDLGINTGGRNSDIERAFEKAAAENAALIKSSAGELLKEIQKLAEKPKGPKRERKKPMTMEDLRNMMREEIEKSRAGTPEAVPEIPQPEPVAGEPEPEGEDAGPSRKELASRKFTERVDRLAKKKARDRLKAAQKKKAAEQKAILRTVTGWDKEEIQDAKPWIQEQREWKRHDARIERAQARAQKKLQRQIARQIGGQKKDIAGYVERGLGLARNVRFHGRMEDTIAHTLIRMLRIGGPYGQALAAVLVAGPVGIKMIEEVVKFLAKKGHPLNRDFFRNIDEEENGLLNEYEKKRRQYAIDSVVFVHSLGYEPLSGSTSRNTLEEADEIVISKIGLAEEAVGIHY